MAHEKNHDYHILNPSVWPLVGAVSGFVLLFGLVLAFHGHGPWIAMMGATGVGYTMFCWWGETIRENGAGDHTPVTRIGLRYGVILFIISEVMFFSAWFWTFFKHAMYPIHPDGISPAVDGVWPPAGVEPFSVLYLPAINTLILLCSGCACTWAHHALVHGNRRDEMKWGLIIAIALGVLFTAFQAYEYSHAAFGFSGNIYGASFFMATGFHGAHVIIGTIFLFVCLMRVLSGHFTPDNHVGFEAAAWYWHFVDVVWLFLFAVVYIWGS